MKRFPDTFVVRLTEAQMKFILRLVYEKARRQKRHVSKSEVVRELIGEAMG